MTQKKIVTTDDSKFNGTINVLEKKIKPLHKPEYEG